MTPKLNTSHFSFEGSLLRTSGAIHCGVPFPDLVLKKVAFFHFDNPKSPT
jgi:hypothetical protein